MKIYTQLDPPPVMREEVDPTDLECLDKVSITSVTEFMQKYQADATFTPPTLDVLFDTDRVDDLSLDDDAEIDSMFIGVEDMDEEIQRARDNK